MDRPKHRRPGDTGVGTWKILANTGFVWHKSKTAGADPCTPGEREGEAMTKSAKLTIRLSPEEITTLKAHARVAGLSQSGYLRMLICGVSPRAAPPEPFYEVMDELRKISGSMAACATKNLRAINSQEYFTMSQELLSKILALQEAVTAPEKIE